MKDCEMQNFVEKKDIYGRYVEIFDFKNVGILYDVNKGLSS